jgi:pyruvate-formate lyase
MNHYKVENPRKNLEAEIAFTKAYRKARKRYKDNKYQIEVECMKAQYPALLHPIEEGDVLAGRHEFGPVGFGMQHQTGGFGFYIHEDEVVHELEHGTGSLKYREDLNEMLVFWKNENTDRFVMRNRPEHLQKALLSDAWEKVPMPAGPILRMAGSFLDFDKLVQIGLPGMEEELKGRLGEGGLDDGQTQFLEASLDMLQLFRDILCYYERQAREMAEEASGTRREELLRLADALCKNQVEKPASYIEAVQLVWMYCLMAPIIDIGRCDVFFGDWYCHDIDNHVLDEEEALKITMNFFKLIDHLDCEVDGRVVLGGYGRRNVETGDRYTLHAIEACRRSRSILPQLTLRFHKETPKEVMEAAIRCIEEGTTYPLLYNDDVIVPGVEKTYGVSRELAEHYIMLGCGEFEFEHYSIASPSGSFNCGKILEIVINGGYDPIGGWKIGPQTPKLTECKTYEEFYGYYLQHLRYYIEAQADFEVYEYEITGTRHPFIMPSLLYDGCVAKAKALFEGGCEYLAGTLEYYGSVDAADSLTAIRKLVFEDKVMSAQTMMDALADNFMDYPRERKMMLDAPKYGADDEEGDKAFVALTDFLNATTAEQAARVGLKSYLPVYINNAQNTTLARWVGALPNGRKEGCAFANANNPESVVDTKGLTPMINSLLKPSHTAHAGMVQNFRFTKEILNTSKDKVLSAMKGYFDRGGSQAMITVVGKEDLKRAMETPEEYGDLIVRVGGFSARFVTLEKDVQKEIYERASF